MTERINVDHTRWQGFSTNATQAAFDPDPRARAVEASISASSALAQDVVGRLLTATAFTRWGIAHSDDRVEHPAAVRELRV
jgi:cystathionine gamma-synthase